jgi:hypothetical protein
MQGMGVLADVKLPPNISKQCVYTLLYPTEQYVYLQYGVLTSVLTTQ